MKVVDWDSLAIVLPEAKPNIRNVMKFKKKRINK